MVSLPLGLWIRLGSLRLSLFAGMLSSRMEAAGLWRGVMCSSCSCVTRCHLLLGQDGVRSAGVKQTFACDHLGWTAQPQQPPCPLS